MSRPAGALAALLACALVGGAQAGGILSTLGRGLLGDEGLFLFGDLGAEIRVGNQVLASHMQEVQGKLTKDAAREAWVQGIFARLVAQVGQTPYTLSVRIVDEDTVNAYALPGGGTFIYKGMLDLAVSDDEVACVMGHEIGHVLRRHGMKRMRRDAVMKGAVQALFKNQPTVQALAGVGATFKGMSFSRQDEDESDAIGMELAWKAGFDPSGATTLWERMRTKFGSASGVGGWTSTHPSNDARIANTRAWLRRRGLPFRRTTVTTDPAKEGTEGWRPAAGPGRSEPAPPGPGSPPGAGAAAAAMPASSPEAPARAPPARAAPARVAPARVAPAAGWAPTPAAAPSPAAAPRPAPARVQAAPPGSEDPDEARRRWRARIRRIFR